MTIGEILKNAGLNHKLSPLDSGILLSLALNRSREYILAHPEKKITSLQEKNFNLFFKRRIADEPIAYITGKKEFFGLNFLVNKNVLVPRPETELLVEKTIEKIKSAKCDAFDAIIDAGTGSGNIIVAIAKNIPKEIKTKIDFYAIDVSKESLQVAKANAKKYESNKKIKFVQSDLLQYFLRNKIKQKNILIVANLPYVSPKIYSRNINNLKFEPKTALLSRNNGLAHYIKLFKQIKLLFTTHCSLILEFSSEQKPEIGRIIKKYLPKSRVEFFKDLSGKWRVAEITT